MHHSFFQHEHVWDYALNLFKQTGEKNIAFELGLGGAGIKLRAEKAGLNWTEEGSTKNRHEEHVFDWAIDHYLKGQDGIKAVAKRLGLSSASLLRRTRGLPRKIQVSTRKKLSGVRLHTELRKKWDALLKRVRKALRKPKPSTHWYYLNHEENKERNKALAKAKYEKQKKDPAVMAERRSRLQAWRKANPELAGNYRKTWREKNPEKAMAAKKRWQANNPEAHREIKRRQDSKPHRVLINRLRTRLRELVEDGKAIRQSIRKLIGCTPAHLRAHIESLFTVGMGWHNRHQWHVDHIKPCALFNLNDPVQLSECWHWTNLQPLWAKDNIAKGAKYHGA